jgi:hypothetical protein
LFVMALGLISLLTLFPVGAIQIGLALRDDRCKQTAVQADAFMRAYWQARVIVPLTDVNPATKPDDFYLAMDDPNWTGPMGTAPSEVFTSPSFPVLVDPIGYHTYSGAAKTAVASDTVVAFPRRNIGIVDTITTTVPMLDQQAALRNCVMLDDWTFVENGLAATNGGVTRVGKYNWAVVLQRPAGASITNRPASMTILCFGERPPLLNSTDNEKLVTGVALTANSTTITGISKPAVTPTDPNSPPLLKKGGWVMDGSIDTGGTPNRYANFYRITNVNEQATTFDIEIEPPLIGPVLPTTRLFFFAGLTEVFQRPPLPGN